VLLMNPKSGGGKVERFHLVEECRRRGIEAVVLQKGDDLLQLTEDAVARGADVIGMAGGDGSQALVASVAARHGVAMVVVPAGTRNHFALDLGLNRDDVVGALDAYGDGFEQDIDLARVNGRVFVNNASLGLYARIVQSEGYRDAKLHTAATMLPDMLGPDATPIDLRFTGPDGDERASANLVMVSNNPYRLTSLSGMGTRERLDGGVLGLLAVTIDGPAQWERFMALEAVGRIRAFPGWMEWSAPSFEIRSAGAVEIGIDGEALAMEPPLTFTSERSALRVRRPRRIMDAGSDRALRLMSRSTVAELGRLVVRQPAKHAG
jgi:diacylglycerol kinase family enzyme